MFNYCQDAKNGINFDMKKFYYSVCVEENEQIYFGFSFVMKDGEPPVMFVFTVMTMGYTRSPFIAKSLMQPLIRKWRYLQIWVTIFYDDGFSVSNSESFLRKAALQIQCDLLRAGLVPGVGKCNWWPQKIIDWIGLRWDFERGGMQVLPIRVVKVDERLSYLINNCPLVSLG